MEVASTYSSPLVLAYCGSLRITFLGMSNHMGQQQLLGAAVLKLLKPSPACALHVAEKVKGSFVTRWPRCTHGRCQDQVQPGLCVTRIAMFVTPRHSNKLKRISCLITVESQF